MSLGRSDIPTTRAGVLLVLASLLPFSFSAAQNPPAANSRQSRALKKAIELEDAFTGVAEKVFRSVVSLTAFERNPALAATAKSDEAWREEVGGRRYPGMRRLASASGLVMSGDGYLLASLGFLEKPGGGLADLIEAELPDGTIVLCEVLGTEPTLDLAVLKVEAFPDSQELNLQPIAIADHDRIRLGQWAIAAGDPIGPERVFAPGLVSSVPQRDCYQASLTATFLQASLPLPPGAAGGALVDIHGAVMGILVPFDEQAEGAGGIVYSIPMAIATGIFDSLKIARSFESPWLGVSVLTISEYRALMQSKGLPWDRKMRTLGVYVDNVFEPSPAARAGIEVGDFLTELDGRKLPTVFDFQKSLYLTGIGRTVTVQIYRNGETLSRQVTIEGRPDEANVSTAN